MAYTVKFIPQENYILTKVYGPLDLAHATAFTTEATTLAKVTDCKRFIFDLTETVLIEMAAGILKYVDNRHEMGFEKSFISAVIYSPDEVDLKFFETAAQKEGYNEKLFTNLEDAIAWINEK